MREIFSCSNDDVTDSGIGMFCEALKPPMTPQLDTVLSSQIHPPTGITHAVSGTFTRDAADSGQPDLVIARATQLELWRPRKAMFPVLCFAQLQSSFARTGGDFIPDAAVAAAVTAAVGAAFT